MDDTQARRFGSIVALRERRELVIQPLRRLLGWLDIPRAGTNLSDLEVLGYAAVGVVGVCMSALASLLVLTLALLPFYPWLKILWTIGR